MRLVGVVPLLGLLLAGCGGGSTQAEPKPLLPVSASPSPTAVALEVPASARAATPEGAAAFARYYLQVLNEANVSNDTTLLQALSEARCKACSALIGAIRKEQGSGNVFSGGVYQVQFAEASSAGPGAYLVDVFYDQTAGRDISSSGRVLYTISPSTRQLLQMRVDRRGTSWQTAALRFVPAPAAS